jgi:transcriptional regulator with PAS, ATPase and Fis domain
MAAPRADYLGEAQDLLLAYEFPGNVRELANIIERAVIVCGDANEVADSHLPDSVRLAAQQTRKHRRPTLAG